MPHLTTDDGVKLYYEEVGSGVPIVFVHEFAGDSRSWESQMRHFCRRYRDAGIWSSTTEVSRAGFARLAESLLSGGYISRMPSYQDCVDLSLC